MRIILYCIFFLLVQFAQSQKIEDGFKSLNEYDYFKAKKIFYKNLKKSPAAAAYGLSKIFFRNDNPFHQYDSAYKYGMMAYFSFSNASDKKKASYERLDVSESKIRTMCDNIFEKSFEHYLFLAGNSKNPDSLLNKYANWYFFSYKREEALKKRDQMLMQQVKNIHQSDSYKRFILDWPESYFLDDAYYLLDKSIYEENTILNTSKSYKNFIVNYPENRFVASAQNEIFKIHKRNRDKEGLIDFIRSYPKNENINEAWKLFFTLTVKQYTAENLADFVLDYPDFPLKKTIIHEIELLNKPLIKIKVNELYGYLDTAGLEVIPARFEEAGEFSEGLCLASENDKFGFIDKNGNWVIYPAFDEVENFVEGVSIVKQKEKFFLIDRTGTKISDDFDEINQFNEGLAVVRSNKKYGAINRLGGMIIPADYDKLGDFQHDHAWFQNNGKYGFIDHNNFISIKNEYDWLDNYSGLIRAKKEKGYGVIDNKGNVIIPFDYERIEPHASGTFLLVKNSKYGFADKTGCLYTMLEYDYDNKLLAEDLIRSSEIKSTIYFKIIMDGEQGLLNDRGRVLAEPGEFEELFLPSSGLIRVFSKDKYYFLDLKFRPVFKEKYEEAEDFINGLSIVKKNNKWQIIDKNGNAVFSEVCISVTRPEDTSAYLKYFIVETVTGKGLLNLKMNWLILPEYQELTFQDEKIIRLTKENKQYLFSTEKNKIIWSQK